MLPSSHVGMIIFERCAFKILKQKHHKNIKEVIHTTCALYNRSLKSCVKNNPKFKITH